MSGSERAIVEHKNEQERQGTLDASLQLLKDVGAGLGREGRLAVDAVCSIPDAFGDAIVNHPGQSLAKVIGAGAISFALGYLSKRTGPGAFLARAAVPALGISFATDVIAKLGDVGTAIRNAWKSDANWDDNVKLMRGSVGALAVDTALCSLGGAVGAQGGRSLANFREGRAAIRLEKQFTTALSGIEIKPNGDTELPIFSQRLGRKAVVHTPESFDPKKPYDVLVTMDSFVAQKTEPDMFGRLSSKTGMSKTNGLDETATRHNFVNLHLYTKPETILPGVHIGAWQSPGAGVLTPGGFLMGRRPQYDDAVYAKDAVLALAAKMNIRSLNFAAFAEGAETAPNVMRALANESAIKAPLKSATLVAGTTFGTEKAPPALQEVLLVRGTKDPNFPDTGGPGKNSQVLSWLGHKNINRSEPAAALENVYARALGVEWTPGPITGEKTAVSPEGRSLTVAVLDGVGSTWPGRNFGAQHESVLSPHNGGKSTFNVNERIAQMVLRAKTLAPAG